MTRKQKNRRFLENNKVLILLATSENKQLMQGKGPFEVEKVVGLNDYGIKIGDKVKLFHVNMLKKYIERGAEQKGEDENVAGSVLFIKAVSVIGYSESGEDDAVDDGNLLELGTTQPEESIADIVFGPELDKDQRKQWQKLTDSFKHIFTDIPENTNIIERELELSSEKPIQDSRFFIVCTIF